MPEPGLDHFESLAEEEMSAKATRATMTNDERNRFFHEIRMGSTNYEDFLNTSEGETLKCPV